MIFLLRQFYLTIPTELSDAARIDGCPQWRILFNIIIPLSKPALITAGIFAFMQHWNDFVGPLIYLNDADKRTLALGLQGFRQMYEIQWNLVMATSSVVIIPIIVLFFALQKYFIRGVIMTGLKG
jgi:ABC-type glycerol-3-phosphate transport system permease component